MWVPELSVLTRVGDPEIIPPLFSSSPPQTYGRDLLEAFEWCKKYQSTSNARDLTQAWELYYNVFRRISKQLPQVRMGGGALI